MAVDTPSDAERRTIPPFLNKTMAWLLGSPLHGLMSKQLMLLTYTGRKSGKSYTIPVGYTRSGNDVLIFTHYVNGWWKNMRESVPVTLHIQGRDVSGTAQAVVEDKQEIIDELSAYITRNPRLGRIFNVTVGPDKRPTSASVQEAAEKYVLLVRVHLN